jgi:hypothetical protein
MGGCHVKPEQIFNLIFGYSDHYAEWTRDNNMPAGFKRETGLVVPAGEIWVLNNVGAQNQQRAGDITLGINDGTNNYSLTRGTASGGAGPVSWNGQLVLPAGWSVSWDFNNTVLNDDCIWWAVGYKMVLSQ